MLRSCAVTGILPVEDTFEPPCCLETIVSLERARTYTPAFHSRTLDQLQALVRGVPPPFSAYQVLLYRTPESLDSAVKS